MIRDEDRRKSARIFTWRRSFLIPELVPGTAGLPRLIRGKTSRATLRKYTTTPHHNLTPDGGSF